MTVIVAVTVVRWGVPGGGHDGDGDSIRGGCGGGNRQGAAAAVVSGGNSGRGGANFSRRQARGKG